MVTLLGLIAFIWFQAPEASSAPKCAGPGTICAEYDASANVFFARVVNVTPTEEENRRVTGPLRAHTVQFEVIEDFKGTVGGGATLAFDPLAADSVAVTAPA